EVGGVRRDGNLRRVGEQLDAAQFLARLRDASAPVAFVARRFGRLRRVDFLGLRLVLVGRLRGCVGSGGSTRWRRRFLEVVVGVRLLRLRGRAAGGPLFFFLVSPSPRPRHV